MFKKVEIWILYLVILLSIFLIVSFGVLVRQELVGNTKLGWISKTALSLSEIPAAIKQILIEDLTVDDRFPAKDGFDGSVNINETYLLLTKYDGLLKEGVVELVDLTNFNVLHTWNPDIDRFNNLVEKKAEFKNLDRDSNNSRLIPGHPKLTKDGGLLFTKHLRYIDACSNLLFQNNDDEFHHSIEIDVDGNIWAPSRMYPQRLPSKKVGNKIVSEGGYYDDAIVKLSPDGKILFEKSVSEIFIENKLEYLLFSVGDRSFTKDPIHLNDIQPVNFDSQYWLKGDVFLSLRHQSMVLLYRPSTNEIVWQGVGHFFHQHDVDILDNHRISVFNNNSKDFENGNLVDGTNEVIIYDFKSEIYSSYMHNSLIKQDVRTITGGRSEILPNGDLFIVENNYGRSLYFNSDGSLRWSHVNRASDGRVYRVGWSRIMYTESDKNNVKKFLNSKKTCSE